MSSIKPIARWTITDIGTLDEYCFKAQLPETGASFTLTLWFKAWRHAGRQVIVRLNAPDEHGWSVVLEDTRLCVEYGRENAAEVRIEGQAVALERWIFAALSFDAATGEIRLNQEARAVMGTSASAQPARLTEILVGGYTDPAGGHYDFTFGRNGSGLVDEVCVYDGVLDGNEIAAQGAFSGDYPTAQIRILGDPEAPCEVGFLAVNADKTRAAVWDFGDGSGALGVNVRHWYAYAGTYCVRLTVVGEGHRESGSEVSVTLTGAADPLQRASVFVNGCEGHACYRIPSIVRAANGDLLAFAEGRRDTCSDSTPTIRVVSKRSRDNGRTWDAMQITAQHMHADGEYALMNPSPVVDTARGTGRIVLLYNASLSNEWALARGEGSSFVYCITSDDHGKTWSAPRDVSAMIRGSDDWRIQRPTLGHALQREDGRIIHASTITVGDASVFHSQNVLVWSDDLGETWQCGKACATVGLNEACAVMLEDGGVLLNSRAYIDGKPAGRRALTRAIFDTNDHVHYDAPIYNDTLIDPAVQGSMLRLTSSRDHETGRRSRILFSNPAHLRARYRLTVRLSHDEGRTWPYQRVIDIGPASYSDLVVQADGQIGVLYERGNQGGIVYAAFTLDWLTQGADTLRGETESENYG